MKYLGDENISYSWNFQSWGSILNSNIIHIKDNFAKLETSGQNQSQKQKIGWFHTLVHILETNSKGIVFLVPQSKLRFHFFLPICVKVAHICK